MTARTTRSRKVKPVKQDDEYTPPVTRSAKRKALESDNKYAPALKKQVRKQASKQVIKAPSAKYPPADPHIAETPSVDDTARCLANLRLDRKLSISDTDTTIIKQNVPGEYEFRTAIDTLDFFHRCAWGVKDSATHIVVNLALLKHERGPHYGFCVHFEPDDLASKYHHNFTTTDVAWQDMVVCNKASNFLTNAISRNLHACLCEEQIDDDSILSKVLEKITAISSSDPTKNCVICSKALSVPLWRPSSCSQRKCRQSIKRWSLETLISPLLRHPTVLDLLFAFMYAGLPTTVKPGVFTGQVGYQIPGLSWNELRKALDAFPKVTAPTSLSELLCTRDRRIHQEKLLLWLCTEFQCNLIPAPTSAKVDFPGSEQFLVLDGPAKREIEVTSGLKQYHKETIGGQGGFHGTPRQNLFSILHQGLLTPKYGVQVGVWYSTQPSYSLGFNRKGRQGVGPGGVLIGPKNSAYMQKAVLFGTEAVHNGDALGSENVLNCDAQERVPIRYVFVLPEDRERKTSQSSQLGRLYGLSWKKHSRRSGLVTWPKSWKRR